MRPVLSDQYVEFEQKALPETFEFEIAVVGLGAFGQNFEQGRGTRNRALAGVLPKIFIIKINKSTFQHFQIFFLESVSPMVLLLF